jgi:hypothetical protein
MALGEFDESTRDGRLLRGEVLARWQDYADSGDLGAALRVKRAGVAVPARRAGRRSRNDTGTARYAALDTAVRAALQALVVSVADRAAEHVTRIWRDNPGGSALLAAAEASRARGERAKREFESAFGSPPPATVSRDGALDRSAPDLTLRTSRAVSAWQDHVMRLLQSDPSMKRAGDTASAALLALVAMLGEPTAAPGSDREDIVTVPAELLASLLGDRGLNALVAAARHDLIDRVRLLLAEELLRFGEVIDDAGPVDAVAAVRLYQAEYSLEAAR